MDQVQFEETVKQWYIDNYEKNIKVNTSILNKVFWILYQKLEVENPSSNIIDIIQIANSSHEVVEKAFFDTFADLRNKLADNTILSFASVSRSALAKMGLSKEKLKIPPKSKKVEDKDDNILPSSVRDLDDNNFAKKFIIDRLEKAKNNTGCNSKTSQVIMLRYWVTILQSFGSLDTLHLTNFSLNNIVNIVKPIITSNYHIIYLHHLFYCITDEWNIKISKLKEHFPNITNTTTDKDGDKDFLTPTQQEDIWKECVNDLEKLVIALLFTTGIRVGGLSNIKKDDIIDKDTNTIKEYGTTLEKGNKTRRFPIFDMVKKPLVNWLNETHMIESPYLFPNSRDLSKPRTTAYFQTLFKTIANRAGYSGDEVHIHSARHSVARNLLEAGNSMDDIGKYLGHANPATTAKFYANLSVKETVDRMNTESIGGTNKKSVREPCIPKFGYDGKEDKKEKKRKSKLSKLADIDIGGKSINEDKLLKALEKARENKK